MRLLSLLFATFRTAHSNVAKPPRPIPTGNSGGYPGSTSPVSGRLPPFVDYNKACGIDIPTRHAFGNGLKDKVNAWMNGQENEYFNDTAFPGTFPQWMRNRWAPSVAPSDMVCDGTSKCSIGSCLNLHGNATREERQYAYYFFEQKSVHDHYYDVIVEASTVAAQYVIENKDTLVRRFTFAPRLQAQAIRDEEMRKIATQLVSTVALIVSSVLGMAAPYAGPATGAMAALGEAVGAATPPSGLVVASAAANLFTSVYIGMTGLINVSMEPRKDTHLVEHVEKLIEGQYIQIKTVARREALRDIEAFNTGRTDKTSTNQSLAELFSDGSFIEMGANMRNILELETKRYFVAGAINSLWTDMERTYILDTDAPGGSCESDTRGTADLRVCLEERPGRSYWLYTIDHSEENDFLTDDQATVKGPPQYVALDGDENSLAVGLTLEDVVRSSLWVHENHLEHKLNANIDTFFHEEKNTTSLHYLNHAGKVPGVFQLAVCRNKFGEAISSIWDVDARNYPCMCGEHRWTKEHNVREDADVNERFYMLSGLYASEDFEDYCCNHMHCHGDNSHHWQFDIKEGMPPRAHQLKHAWKKCKEPKEHSTDGNVEIGRKEGAAGNQNDNDTGKRSLNTSDPLGLYLDGLMWRG